MPSELFERDVLEAMQDAKMRFRVDDSRVYLAGECLGGRNAFLLAEDYPEMFSALSTFEAFTGQSSAIMNKPSDSGNALIRLRNLSSMPIRLIHGEANFHSPSAQATILMQEAQKVGVFPEFVPLPGDGTFALISPHRKMFEFFATVRSRPPAAPHHVALATTELEHNHAFWIRVDRVRKTNAPAFLTADIEAQNQININSANVQGATINTLKLPPDLAGMKSWVVVCNGGQEQRLLPDSMGEIVLNISGDGQVTR
jgi:predicted peptidase